MNSNLPPIEEVEKLTQALIERDNKLQRREEWFRKIVQSVSEGLIAFDMAGRINLVNPAAITMFGYRKYQDIYGKQVAELITSDVSDIPKWFQTVPKNPIVLTGISKSGDIFPISISLSKGGANGHSFILAVVRNLNLS